MPQICVKLAPHLKIRTIIISRISRFSTSACVTVSLELIHYHDFMIDLWAKRMGFITFQTKGWKKEVSSRILQIHFVKKFQNNLCTFLAQFSGFWLNLVSRLSEYSKSTSV